MSLPTGSNRGGRGVAYLRAPRPAGERLNLTKPGLPQDSGRIWCQRRRCDRFARRRHVHGLAVPCITRRTVRSASHRNLAAHASAARARSINAANVTTRPRSRPRSCLSCHAAENVAQPIDPLVARFAWERGSGSPSSSDRHADAEAPPPRSRPPLHFQTAPAAATRVAAGFFQNGTSAKAAVTRRVAFGCFAHPQKFTSDVTRTAVSGQFEIHIAVHVHPHHPPPIVCRSTLEPCI